MRCPVCRAESKLIHFGIYLCPNCGTTDPDGRPVTPPPGTPLTPGPSSLHEAAPTPVSDDTQPTSLAFPPSVPLAPPRPLPLELAPPRPPTPVPMAPRPVPLAAAPPHPLADPLTAVPRPEDVSRNSFAPPPPRDPRDLVQASSGPPQILVVMLAVYFVLELGQLAISQLPGCCVAPWMLLRLGFLVALLSGRVWARTASLVGSALGILGELIAITQPLTLGPRIYLGVMVMLEITWLYVLTRPDVVKHFTSVRR